MTRSHKVLGFLLVALLGIYGCARGPAAGSADGRAAAAEARVQRLEEDFRAAAAARDTFRQRVIAAEEKQSQLQKQLEQATATAAQERQEREAAKAELKSRTAERDNLQVQYEAFRKNIRELLGSAESALNTPPAAATPPVLIGTQTSPPVAVPGSVSN
jgi:hypothetical protein